METIKVETTINVPVEKAWRLWTTPEHIEKWNQASDDWHTPKAENDLRIGGKFVYRMEAKDKTSGFDFEGVYDEIILNRFITYTLADGRNVSINFSSLGNQTKLEEVFEPESINSMDLQRQGWQAIVDNFKKYAEESLTVAKI